jgi:hypothetical protein
VTFTSCVWFWHTACDVTTHVCYFNTHKSDFFTQSVILTRISVIMRCTSVIYTRTSWISTRFKINVRSPKNPDWVLTSGYTTSTSVIFPLMRVIFTQPKPKYLPINYKNEFSQTTIKFHNFSLIPDKFITCWFSRARKPHNIYYEDLFWLLYPSLSIFITYL